MLRLLFQGDSITDGNRYKEERKRWDLNHQIGHSYVFDIVGELGTKYPGKFCFINRGVSGDSVSTIAPRWQAETIDEKPDILSVLLGINGNGKRNGVFPLGEDEHVRVFDEGYRALLSSARKANPDLKLILIEPFSLPVGEMKPTYAEFYAVFSRMQAAVKKIAEDFGAAFVPVQNKLERLVEKTAPILAANGCPTDPYAYWLWDGVHPTEPMHKVLADLWLKEFYKII
ncbi:MAG: SGNH/GDSL hydrolase family protein [Clostridia bacterium]|nr:SGNH/GDSL hydrolase family protein [Clostridia bacterium]